MTSSLTHTIPAIDSVHDAEYIILENIYGSGAQPIRQRDLAQIAGASLGMTNSILKRLAQKGWISVKKLNSRNIQYVITPGGMNEIIHRSYRYFKRTIRNVVYFKDVLENLVYEAGQKSIHTVILVGPSDLDFIVEHACQRCGLKYKKIRNTGTADRYIPETLKIYSETIREHEAQDDGVYLSSLIIHQAAKRL